MATPLKALAEHGQSPWIDFLSRSFVRDGDLAGLIDEGILGLTSNPTIFQKAVSDGNPYDAQLRELKGSATDPKDVFFELARNDIRDACDLFKPVFERG